MKALVVAAALITAGCSSDRIIRIDGSSTVFPVTAAVAEAYHRTRGGDIAVGVSGTGGGFKKFCRGETAITGASRPITSAELERCARGGVEFIELPIAVDGIVVVVGNDNDWARTITTDELALMWGPSAQGAIDQWNQVRRQWPERPLHLFGPGVSSGTYDHFTRAILGQPRSSRGDFTVSEDDNVLVQGVATHDGGLGFFGFAYYAANRDRLRALAVDGGRGPVAPTVSTIASGAYAPLSRPLFLYVSTRALERAEVARFVEFYLEQRVLIEDVGYVPLPGDTADLVRQRLERRTTGSAWVDGDTTSAIDERLRGDQGGDG